MNYQHTALTALDDLILSFDRRLTALEKVKCSPASPAPSDGASASSGGAATAASVGPHTASAVATETDPSAAIRTDPNRPAWLTDAMLPLPVGTEKVYCVLLSHGVWAFPCSIFWSDNESRWVKSVYDEDEVQAENDIAVYHVPPPQPERAKTKHDALYDAARKFILSSRFEEDNATQQALAEAVRQLTPMRDDPVHDTHARPEKAKDDFTLLPPAEIADHATELGWTVESEVWKSRHGQYISVRPGGKWLEVSTGSVQETNCSTQAEEWEAGYTLLPNRRVPKNPNPTPATVGISPTTPTRVEDKPAAASAWEEYLSRGNAPWCTARFTDHDVADFNAFVAAREKAAVEAWNRTIFPITATHPSGALSVKVHIEDGNCVVATTDAKPLPKPDAGRAEGVKCLCEHPDYAVMVGHDFGPSAASTVKVCSRCLTVLAIERRAPKPRRAPEVVAREVADKIYAYNGQGWEFAKQVVEAAVRADRGEG